VLLKCSWKNKSKSTDQYRGARQCKRLAQNKYGSEPINTVTFRDKRRKATNPHVTDNGRH
ncbi:hypothetical protein J6590_026710, partial [Homalodisca vitripennis]